MSFRWLESALSLGLAMAAVGCAASFDPANFQGTREPRRAEPEAVLDVAAGTSDLELLGTVRADCQLQTGFRRLNGERLSDVDCSRERLLLVLRESAASAGGEVLVAPQCNSRRIGVALPETQHLQCAAGVARYVSGPTAVLRPLSVPRSPAPGRPAPRAEEGKRI